MTFTIKISKGKYEEHICGISEARVPILTKKYELEGYRVTSREEPKMYKSLKNR